MRRHMLVRRQRLNDVYLPTSTLVVFVFEVRLCRYQITGRIRRNCKWRHDLSDICDSTIMTLLFLNKPPSLNQIRSLIYPLLYRGGDVSKPWGACALELTHVGVICFDAVVGHPRQQRSGRICIYNGNPVALLVSLLELRVHGVNGIPGK